MGEKRYYWLKLRNDFFDSVRMKKLRGVAGGDTYTIIYLKLQLAALETEGTLIYEGVENSLAEELALLINEKPEDVGLTLNFLQSVGLCEVSKDGALCTLPEVLLNTGSETSSTQRVRNLRKRQTLQCNADVTEVKRVCNVEKEIEKEIEIEREKKEKKEAPPRRFTKPTLSEIEDFINENNYIVNATKFFDYYESNGWKVGRNSMKDWKAAVRSWEAKEQERLREKEPKERRLAF
ncbi:MAG: phage replisome organizer N-terminal domain-containing protein [Oscillospiraceae bacterium]|nr:phage replisome organizer N-terminal domain-containing protein [Oscillospiraceae bacterium]